MADTTQPFIPDHRGGPRYLDEAEKRSPELCAQLTVLINDFRTTRPDIAHDIRVDTPYAKVRGLLSDGPDLLRSFEKFLPKIEALSGEALEQEMTEHKQE